MVAARIARLTPPRPSEKIASHIANYGIEVDNMDEHGYCASVGY
jgi:hypothetical protein